MTLAEQLVLVWKKSLVEGLAEVQVLGSTRTVGRTRGKGLRTVAFEYEGFVIEGIEQNPQTSSRWAKLAQEGQRIMQFKHRERYFANVCEGQVMRYPGWKGLGLPE